MNNTGKYIQQKKNCLSIYFTAGYPSMQSISEIILELQNNKVDLIEVGIPFSDPLADGPVIQWSAEQALNNGFSLDALFKNLNSIKEQLNIPLVMMGYFNTMLTYGIEKFLNNCRNLGMDTIIIPDLPLEIYLEKFQLIFEKHGISPVFLITPKTPLERIKEIEKYSNAFIYAVSDNSITGTKNGFSEDQLKYFKRIQEMNLQIPVMIGFGISNKETFESACQYANGAIIGSAFIKSINPPKQIDISVNEFIQTLI